MHTQNTSTQTNTEQNTYQIHVNTIIINIATEHIHIKTYTQNNSRSHTQQNI